MRVNITTTTGTRIAVEEVANTVDQTAPPSAINGRLKSVAVLGKQHEEARQVIGMPLLADEALGKSDVARFHHGGAGFPAIECQIGGLTVITEMQHIAVRALQPQ